MKKTSHIKFQTVSYPIFDHAFMGALIIDKNENEKIIFFLQNIYPTKKELLTYAQYVRDNVNSEEGSDISVSDTILVVPLTLKEKKQLLRKYWNIPSNPLDYDLGMRTECLMNTLATHQLYNLLVTPNFVDEEGNKQLAAAFAYRVGIPEELELFMSTSNWPVDPEATHFYVYEIGKPMGQKISNSDEDETINIDTLIPSESEKITD